MMKNAITETSFFPYLMTTHWFKETVEFYFNSDYELKYDEILHGFIKKGVVKRHNHKLTTTVKK
jgi:hypothetical protein